MISIIIPVYNQSTALVKALDSIFAQTYKDIEVIVVDDGSVEEINIEYSILNIKYIQQKHAGANTARNRGFAASKGDYIIFWDADVVGKPDMLEKMMRALAEHPETSYAYCNFCLEQGKLMKGRPFDAGALKKINFIHTTSLIRRADFPLWDETMARFQDWDVWLTMLEQDKIGVWIPETLFRIITKGTISQWFPRFAYHVPWKYLPGIRRQVMDYEKAHEIIRRKHAFTSSSPTSQTLR